MYNLVILIPFSFGFSFSYPVASKQRTISLTRAYMYVCVTYARHGHAWAYVWAYASKIIYVLGWLFRFVLELAILCDLVYFYRVFVLVSLWFVGFLSGVPGIPGVCLVMLDFAPHVIFSRILPHFSKYTCAPCVPCLYCRAFLSTWANVYPHPRI